MKLGLHLHFPLTFFHFLKILLSFFLWLYHVKVLIQTKCEQKLKLLLFITNDKYSYEKVTLIICYSSGSLYTKFLFNRTMTISVVTFMIPMSRNFYKLVYLTVIQPQILPSSSIVPSYWVLLQSSPCSVYWTSSNAIC